MYLKKTSVFLFLLLLCNVFFYSSSYSFAQRLGGNDKPAESLKEAKPKKGGKIKVAVIPQDRERQWTKEITVASLEDALVGGGRFAVLSRSELDSVLREQKFSSSDLVDPNAAVNIGKALAAQYVIIAKCVSLEVKSGGFSFGGYGQKTNAMTCTLQMQLIDTETTQIVESQSYTDKFETKSSQIGTLASTQADAPGQEAYRKIVDAFAKKFAEKLSLAIPIEALVVLVKNNQVAIDAGTDKAITAGLEFEVILEGEPIRDASGAVLSYDTTKVGIIRVARVEPKISWCDVIQTFDANGTPDAGPNPGRIQRDYAVRQTAKASGTQPVKKK